MTTAHDTDSDYELLSSVLDELFTKKRVNRSKYFLALELIGDIAKESQELRNAMQLTIDRLCQAITRLRQENSTLAGLAIYQANISTGHYREYQE